MLWINDRRDLANALIYPIKYQSNRSAELAWVENEERLQLTWVEHTDKTQRPRIDHVLPTDPPWHIDNLTCGPLELIGKPAQVPAPEFVALVAQAPAIAISDRQKLAQHLLTQGLNRIVPMPQTIAHAVRNDLAMQPVLTLDCRQRTAQMLDFAALSFDYGGASAEFDPATTLVRKSAQGIEIIQRNTTAESTAWERLLALGFTPSETPLSASKGQLQFSSQSAWVHFVRIHKPALEAEGWQIKISPRFQYDVQDHQGWYARLSHTESTDVYTLEIGIRIDNETYRLLPVLQHLMRRTPDHFRPEQMASHAAGDEMLVPLPDGRRTALRWSRVRTLLDILGELYYHEPVGESINLGRLDAPRLIKLEEMLQIQCEAADEWRALGQRLLHGTDTSALELPKRLKATLREYQKEGLAWMQMLREQPLCGILADDMGLGKTIQTLAHLQLEKESGRLDRPALIIAPTSLLANWQEEAACFTPDLRVLCLHGRERLLHFEKIRECDLILTSYALLPREYAKLRDYSFHLLILDESHYIKNVRAKVTQSAASLDARHRLCLTGTPLENHLGELWSQFNFLMPGFLGDERRLNVEFRNPIEKHKDQARRASLSRRIQSFVLRRTKDKVAKELPEKTEVVRHIELNSAQRELYESLRVVLDAKVRNEIAEKGMARSQIVILDAMRKLRQICCDPRLVKRPSPESIASAKLDELLDMLDELLEQGRKILVFSQFSSMLHLIEEALDARKIRYALLTGETRDRAEEIARFQQRLVPVFLISLKAGGVGLNLTAADTVIHYDPWWNPAAENQATDRAWRIGQNKPVFVYKLIARGTLEETIQEMQIKKADLARAILSGAETLHLHMTQQELKEIFAPIRNAA